MGFKNFLHEYFTFNRRERNGVFVLLCIILFMMLYLSFSDYFYSEEKIDFSQFEKEVNAFEMEQKRLTDSIFGENIQYPEETAFSRSDFFYYPKKKKVKTHKKETHSPNVLTIELNTADTAELKKIKGIGSVFAKRIVRFRDALGGFVNKEQLLEVYGLDQEKFNLISSQLVLDVSDFKKININTASVTDLEKHPYITKRMAVAIFTHRITVGDYADIKDIKKLTLTDEKMFDKIAPYLSVE